MNWNSTSNLSNTMVAKTTSFYDFFYGLLRFYIRVISGKFMVDTHTWLNQALITVHQLLEPWQVCYVPKETKKIKSSVRQDSFFPQRDQKHWRAHCACRPLFCYILFHGRKCFKFRPFIKLNDIFMACIFFVIKSLNVSSL